MSRSHARQTLMGLVAERVMHVARRLTVESRSGKTVPGEIVFGLGEGPGSLHGGTGNDLLDAILGRLAKSGQDLAEDGPHGEAGARREALRGQMALMGALYGGNWKRGSQENLGVTEMQT